MIRRRLLLALLSNTGSWELFSQQYLYYTLIPQTINSKSVKNKAKVSKIYGNGVIENQLVQLSNIPSTNTTNGVTFTKNDDGSLTISGTASATFDKVVCASVPLTNGHKYISITYEGSANVLKNWVSGVATGETYNKGLFFTTTSSGNVSLYMTFYSGKQYNFTFYPQITDLTLREGTGNEPTTLTDNRIQNILNRGYIPYNTGEYKGTDIGEFSTTKEDTSTLDTITFKAQLGGAINSHDTMEIGKENVVFTKKRNKFDMGSKVWTYVSSQSIFFLLRDVLPTDFKQDSTNGNQILCEAYTTMSIGNINNVPNNTMLGFDNYNGQYLMVKTTDYASASDFRTAMTGKIIDYELATPQVITIPRKHLGIVDLGSLSWEYVGGSYTAYAQLTGAKQISSSIIANIYCSKYMTYKEDDITSKTSGISLANVLIVQDSSLGTNATQIKQALAGQYLFYETENEVADITDTIDIESGGTITTDSEVLPNVDLSVKCK